MDQSNTRRQVLLLAVVLAAVTLATFWPVLRHDFINYDDPDYVTENDWVKRGLTWDGVKWAFTTGHASNWHPITWISHMLDVSLFGMNPSGHHGTNLLFHIANSVLLLLLLYQMTGAVWRSTLVAAWFALHPLHVESVAWVAERKDVLSTCFGLSCLIAYANFARCSRLEASSSSNTSQFLSGMTPCAWRWYAAAFLLLALGLMSKPMLVTWPFVMLLLDFWPLGRVARAVQVFKTQAWRTLAIEKAPFAVLSLGSIVSTLVAQRDAMADPQLLSLSHRIGNAFISYATYLGQTIWPARLAVFYPSWGQIPTNSLLLSVSLLLTLTALAIGKARTQPFWLMGWLWYVVTLLPVIGIVQVGDQAHADRYTYLPLIGIFTAFSWGVAAIVSKHRTLTLTVPTAMAIVLLASCLATNRQVGFWGNSRTLFTHTAEVTRGNYIALGAIGIDEAQQGNWAAAMTHLNQALESARLHKTEGAINYFLGVVLQMQGQGLAALPHLERAVVPPELRPERDFRLGLSLIEANRLVEAESPLRNALKAKPNNAEFKLGLAALLLRQGKASEAEDICRDVLVKHPNSSTVQSTYGEYLRLTGRRADAEKHFMRAIELNPADVTARVALGSLFHEEGRLAQALNQYEEAAREAPNQPRIAFALAELLVELQQPAKAVVWYEAAIQRDPKYVDALNNLAWLLATHPDEKIRDGAKAVELARRACQLTDWRIAIPMGTLAAAYAETGEFSNAVLMATKARDQANAEGEPDLAQKNEALLKHYQGGMPFRSN